MRGGSERILQVPILAHSASLPAIYLVSAIVAYKLFSLCMYAPHGVGSGLPYAYVVVTLLILSSIKVSYVKATAAYRTLTRAVIAFATFYVLASHIHVPGILTADNWLGEIELNRLWIVAAICGVIGFVRPSFGLIPLLYIRWQKIQLVQVFGLQIDWMDHFTLIETGVFLILGYMVLSLFRVFAPNLGWSADKHWAARGNASPLTGSVNPVDALVLLTVAFHFGNYFYAGLVKASLGDGPLYWVLDNRTELLVLAAWENGVLPVSFNDWLPGLTYEFISYSRVVTNLITIAIQLLAVIAIVRIRWAIWVTLSYDVLHFMIFVTTGIFFWKFIILNVAIVAALSVMRARHMTINFRVALASAVACSPFVFHIMPSFAWLDTPAVNQVRLYAVTEDGKEYRVPSNYFLGASVTLAQNRMLWSERGAFPTSTWGTTRNFDIAKRGLACDWDGLADDGQVPFSISRSEIEAIVRRHHTQILSMVDGRGVVDYDLFPHHIFSVPWEFVDFKKLDKRRIRSYRYESEAVCLGYDDGAVTRKRIRHSTFDIAL